MKKYAMKRVAKYLIRSMNKKITKETMEEYTKSPLQLNTVNGRVRKIVIISITEKTPETRIVLSFSLPTFLFGGFTSLLSSAIWYFCLFIIIQVYIKH